MADVNTPEDTAPVLTLAHIADKMSRAAIAFNDMAQNAIQHGDTERFSLFRERGAEAERHAAVITAAAWLLREASDHLNSVGFDSCANRDEEEEVDAMISSYRAIAGDISELMTDALAKAHGVPTQKEPT